MLEELSDNVPFASQQGASTPLKTFARPRAAPRQQRSASPQQGQDDAGSSCSVPGDEPARQQPSPSAASSAAPSPQTQATGGAWVVPTLQPSYRRGRRSSIMLPHGGFVLPAPTGLARLLGGLAHLAAAQPLTARGGGGGRAAAAPQARARAVQQVVQDLAEHYREVDEFELLEESPGKPSPPQKQSRTKQRTQDRAGANRPPVGAPAAGAVAPEPRPSAQAGAAPLDASAVGAALHRLSLDSRAARRRSGAEQQQQQQGRRSLPLSRSSGAGHPLLARPSFLEALPEEGAESGSEASGLGGGEEEEAEQEEEGVGLQQVQEGAEEEDEGRQEQEEPSGVASASPPAASLRRPGGGASEEELEGSCGASPPPQQAAEGSTQLDRPGKLRGSAAECSAAAPADDALCQPAGRLSRRPASLRSSGGGGAAPLASGGAASRTSRRAWGSSSAGGTGPAAAASAAEEPEVGGRTAAEPVEEPAQQQQQQQQRRSTRASSARASAPAAGSLGGAGRARGAPADSRASAPELLPAAALGTGGEEEEQQHPGGGVDGEGPQELVPEASSGLGDGGPVGRRGLWAEEEDEGAVAEDGSSAGSVQITGEAFGEGDGGDAEPALSGLQQLLRICGQEVDEAQIPAMEDLLALGRGGGAGGARPPKVHKVGEGSFGEAFKVDRAVVKVIPIEGSTHINGQPQKAAAEVAAEVLVSLTLSQLRDGVAGCSEAGRQAEAELAAGSASATSGFVQTFQAGVCRAPYAPALVRAWHAWDKKHGSENDPVDGICDGDGGDGQQLFLVISMADCGKDLEKAEVASFDQARCLLLQATFALAAAEAALQFEHRDLHWGNVLLRASPNLPAFLPGRLRGRPLRVATCGAQVSLIDFTASRLRMPGGAVVFCDLAQDEELFEGPAKHVQFDTYRHMRAATGNAWAPSCLATNALWLAYLAEVLAAEKAAGFTFTFADASANNVTACKRRLREFRRRAAQAGSAEALLDDPLFEGLLEEDWDDTAGKAEGGRGARDQGSKPGAAPAARGAAARRGAA